MNLTVLPQSFYNRPCVQVARGLLGKILVHAANGSACSGRIVETEAYLAVDDPACHAWRGRTARNSVMFGEPGIAYVYFCYGNHWLMNAVAEQAGCGAAVLIRAAEPLDGIECMRGRRGVKKDTDLTSGPGKLCAALNITGNENGLPLFNGDLRICDDGFSYPEIKVSSRIGINVGTDIETRYYVPGNPFVSARPKT